MSNEITTAMVDTYNTGIEMLAQQMMSKLRSRVREESKTGNKACGLLCRLELSLRVSYQNASRQQDFEQREQL